MKEKTKAYKLYGIPYLGSMVIEFLLEEVGIEYEIFFLSPEERQSPADVAAES